VNFTDPVKLKGFSLFILNTFHNKHWIVDYDALRNTSVEANEDQDTCDG